MAEAEYIDNEAACIDAAYEAEAERQLMNKSEFGMISEG